MLPVAQRGADTSSTVDYQQLGYDPAGNVTSLRTRAGATIGFSYDALNRVTAKLVPERAGLSAAQTRDVHYGYDLLGRLKEARFDSLTGEGVSNAFDALGRLTSTTTNMGGTARTLSSQYDAAGRRTRLTYPDGSYFNYFHDMLGRMTTVRESDGDPVVSIGYDAQGRRASVGYLGGTSMSYGYDAVGRLGTLTHNLDGTAYDQTITLGYNPAGQIVSRTGNNDTYAYSELANQNRTESNNGLNQNVAVAGVALAHDANGNVTSNGAGTFTYDVENRLVGASGGAGASLTYDPLGRLVQVTSGTATTRRVYDGDALVAEHNGSGAQLRRFVHGPGVDEPLVWYEGNPRRYLYADERGSVTAANQAYYGPLFANRYDEHGAPQSGNQGRFGYTGQQWLPEIGLHYYKARMYDPARGRFMQNDRLGYVDGMNLYAYVGGDPVNFVDPTGLECTPKEMNEDRCVVTGVRLTNAARIVLGGAGIIQPRMFSESSTGGGFADIGVGDPVRYLDSCQRRFFSDQLARRSLPTSHLSQVRFISGIDGAANSLSAAALNSGAVAVTQGNNIYVQPGRFDEVSLFRSDVGFEEVYHTAQFALHGSSFYQSYGISSIGGILSGQGGYRGNLLEAFAKGAAIRMQEAARSVSCMRQ